MKSLATTLVVSSVAAYVNKEVHPMISAPKDVNIIKHSEEDGGGFSMRLHP